VSERNSARLFRGLRDLLPQEMAARQWLIDTIRGVYESYGFVPLGTPAVEYLDVLVGSGGGEESSSSIFHVRNPDDPREKDPGERLGLRFDLTVPLARVVSQYRDLPRPFRRYQVSPVWRADKPDRGRFREFIQFDIDSVGVDSFLADVEIITAMCDTLAALNVGAYQVRFSSRRVLNLLLKYAEVPDTFVSKRGGPVEATANEEIARVGSDVFRVLDKLDKIQIEGVRRELTTGYKDKSGDWISGLGLSSEQADRIEQFIAIRGDRREDVLRQLTELFSKVPGAQDEIDLLGRMSRQLANLGYGDDRVALDLSVARGLAYYTGPVFEAVLPDAPQFGSVMGGGRYDELVMRFLGEKVPATGASIGVDRLLAALIHLGRAPMRKSTAQVLVAVLDEAMIDDYLAMTFELRRAGIPTEMYLGSKKGLGKQFKYADQIEIPVVVVCGGDEKARGTVTLKNMGKGKESAANISDRAQWVSERPGQIEAPRGDLIEAARAMLRESQS
jgi:histidyl-tRNA synthetase